MTGVDCRFNSLAYRLTNSGARNSKGIRICAISQLVNATLMMMVIVSKVTVVRRTVRIARPV